MTDYPKDKYIKHKKTDLRIPYFTVMAKKNTVPLINIAYLDPK